MDANFNTLRAVLCDGHFYRVRDNVWVNDTPADFKSAATTGARGYGSGLYGLADYGQDDEDRGGSLSIMKGLPIAHTLDNWNDQILFGSSADGRVFVWDPATPATPAAPCTATAGTFPTLVQTFLVTDEHHLMVFGGDGYPSRVAWSDQGNRQRWDYAAVTGQAGFNDLEGAGQIYSARKIPGGILIFTQTHVWLCTYIGAPYFYGFKKIAEHLAPVSPQAIVVAAGKAFWMTAKGFAQYVAGTVSPLPCTLDLDPAESMDVYMAPQRVCAGFNGVYNEAWWFYPSRGQNGVPENDRYVIFNFADGWWSDGYQGRSFYTASPIEGKPFAGAPNRMIYQHENSWKNEGNPRWGEVWAEISSLSFDDGDSVYSVTHCQVDGRGLSEGRNKGAVKFYFSGATVRGEKYKPLWEGEPSSRGYLDARFSAKDFSLRLVGMQDTDWGVGAMNFTTVKRGKA
jgi:hypothetical protein